MIEDEFNRAVDEIVFMHKKIYRQRSPEYVYDRWWKLELMRREALEHPGYGMFTINYKLAKKLTGRVRRIVLFQKLLLLHMKGEAIPNQDYGSWFIWKHVKIYGREYIYNAAGQFHPAIVSSNCYYSISYHDEGTM